MSDALVGKKVLVTGAGGFIGSHLVERLVQSGAGVRAFVRYNSRGDPGLLRFIPADIANRMELIPGDLKDADAVRQAVDGCSLVFHLGAMISIPYSYKHPVEVATANLIGTLNVLTACRDLGVERLIHTSSSEVYGTALSVPIDENHPLQGQSPYSASKIGADKLVESYYCAYGLPAVTVRPFNTFGPRQSARGVIPTIITQALKNRVIKLGNLDTTRDFTYVSDTVAGFLKAAQADNAVGRTFNLGTGVEIRIGDLVQKVAGLIGSDIEIHQDQDRMRPERSEVRQLISDNSLARSVLGWSPDVSLEEGLKRTIEWIDQHIDIYKVGVYEF